MNEMLKAISGFMKGPELCDENSGMLNRLRKQTKADEQIEESVFDDELGTLNDRNKAVLLTQQANRDRCHWPQLKNNSPNLSPGRSGGDGFWDRAVSAQKEALKNRQNILGSLNFR